MNASTQSQLFALAITVLIVVRFLFRELRARTVRLGTLWIRPALLVLLTALVVWGALHLPSTAVGEVALSLLAGAAIGIVVGALVNRSTSVETTDIPHSVRLRGSWVTVAIWVAALVLRLGVRFVFGGSFEAATSMVASAGTIAMVATAFATFSLLVTLRARTLGSPGAPGPDPHSATNS